MQLWNKNKVILIFFTFKHSAVAKSTLPTRGWGYEKFNTSMEEPIFVKFGIHNSIRWMKYYQEKGRCRNEFNYQVCRSSLHKICHVHRNNYYEKIRHANFENVNMKGLGRLLQYSPYTILIFQDGVRKYGERPSLTTFTIRHPNYFNNGHWHCFLICLTAYLIRFNKRSRFFDT